MKKIGFLVLLFFSMFLLIGCDSLIQAESITIDSIDDTYVIGDEFDYSSLKITAVINGVNKNFFGTSDGVRVEGFDTSTAGTKNAKITYACAEVSFTYTVLDE